MRTLPATGADCPELCCGADAGFGLQKERIIKVGTNRRTYVCEPRQGFGLIKATKEDGWRGCQTRCLYVHSTLVNRIQQMQRISRLHLVQLRGQKMSSFSVPWKQLGADNQLLCWTQVKALFCPKILCPQDLRLVPGRSRWGGFALW